MSLFFCYDSVTILLHFIIITVTLPAGIALNGYPDVRGKPVHCSFKGISAADECYINSVVDGIFPTTMEEFKAGTGVLHPWLKGLTATLIMSYNSMVGTLGPRDLIVHRMETVFQSISGLNMKKLEERSSRIKDHFKRSNKRVATTMGKDDATQAEIVKAINNNTADTVTMTSQNNALNQQIIRSNEREQILEKKVSRLEYELAEKDVAIQYWKLKSEHRQTPQRTPQKSTHSNHHCRTPPSYTAASVPVHGTATINTTVNTNNDVICDVDNVNNDDDHNFFMMDDVVNNNAHNNNNNNTPVPLSLSPQELKYVIRDNPKAEAPGKGTKLGMIIKQLKEQNHMARYVDENGMFVEGTGYFLDVGRIDQDTLLY